MARNRFGKPLFGKGSRGPRAANSTAGASTARMLQRASVGALSRSQASALSRRASTGGKGG